MQTSLEVLSVDSSGDPVPKQKQRRLGSVAITAILVATAPSCAAPTRPNTSGQTPTTVAVSTAPTGPLGRWVASCADISIDAKRLKEDISAGAPALLHATSLIEAPFRSQALAAIAPLAACTDSDALTDLTRALPSKWQTSGAEQFARLISSTFRSGAAPGSADNGGCPACRVTGTMNFTHPTWGQVRIETYTERSFPVFSDSKSGYRIIDPSDGRLLHDKAINDMLYELGIESRSADGFMFITYNPGRYNGVIVLRATKDGIEDFGTDSFPRTYSGRFYNAKVQFGASSGFSIILSQNDCLPSCAAGTIKDTKFVYDEAVNDLIPS
jgi:hypothetical protein